MLVSQQETLFLGGHHFIVVILLLLLPGCDGSRLHPAEKILHYGIIRQKMIRTTAGLVGRDEIMVYYGYGTIP